jgi:hypothetical protein
MFDNIEVKDAVRRAMQTEKNAMEFYLRGAEMMKNAHARSASMPNGSTMSIQATTSPICRNFSAPVPTRIPTG